MVPSLQKLKEENETAMKIINSLPEDVAEEIAPRLLFREIQNDKILSVNIPSLPFLMPEALRVIESSTGGTISPYISSASAVVSSCTENRGSKPDWTKYVTVIMDEYSAKVAQQNYLPERLQRINRDLGKQFNIALRSFNKCKNGIIKVNSVAIDLRDVLQQVWGGLSAMAKDKNKDLRRNTNDLQLRKEGDRNLVSEILASETFPQNRLNPLLSELYALHYKLSDTRFGKNLLNNEFPTLNIYCNEWLALLDAISGIVV
jgi:hypothetical protein